MLRLCLPTISLSIMDEFELLVQDNGRFEEDLGEIGNPLQWRAGLETSTNTWDT
jgi:hypothetical protein